MRCSLILFLTLLLFPLTITHDAAARVPDETSTTQRGRPMHLVKKYDNLPDVICRKKRRAHDRPGRCKRVVTLRTTYRYRVPNPVGQRTDADAVAPFPTNKFFCKDWSAVSRGLYYVNWKEEMKGTYCWIRGPRFPEIYQNDWGCGYSSAIGYDIHVEDCWDERRTGDTTAGWWISVYDKWRVSAAFRGFPLHWTYQMHVNLHPTGTITLKHDN